MKEKIIFIVFLLCINAAYASTIHGKVYDLSFQPLANVVIEVNSTPSQRHVSTDGSYSFTMPIGSYSLNAEYTLLGDNYQAEESIDITEEGNYQIDLFLFPEFEEDNLTDIDFNNIEDNDESDDFTFMYYSFGVALIAVVLIMLYFSTRKSKKEEVSEDVYLEKVFKIIKDNGGRTTQKDIRKQIPLSEAKISLIITELEANGKIKKIKKGRGNIIILNKL